MKISKTNFALLLMALTVATSPATVKADTLTKIRHLTSVRNTIHKPQFSISECGDKDRASEEEYQRGNRFGWDNFDRDQREDSDSEPNECPYLASAEWSLGYNDAQKIAFGDSGPAFEAGKDDGYKDFDREGMDTLSRWYSHKSNAWKAAYQRGFEIGLKKIKKRGNSKGFN